MSYKTSEKRQYELPRPSTGLKRKPGFKPSKGSFEKDLIGREAENVVKDKDSEGTE
jgi:hypothetical protein